MPAFYTFDMDEPETTGYDRANGPMQKGPWEFWGKGAIDEEDLDSVWAQAPIGSLYHRLATNVSLWIKVANNKVAADWANWVNSYDTGLAANAIHHAGTLTLPQAIAYASGDIYDPKAYGAVGNGTTDDTTAVQAALTAAGNAAKGGRVIPSPGSYRITRNLYIFGNTDLIGNGLVEFVVDASMAAADGIEYWFLAGMKAKAGTKVVWTGKVEGVKFRCTANAGGIARLFAVMGGLDWWITRCVFDLTALPDTNQTGGIGCYPNANWRNPYSCIRGHIIGNTLLANQNADLGSEGIGLASAVYISIKDNYVYGFGDDAIGVHACDHVTVADNWLYTSDGRIYASGCRYVLISGNWCERIQDNQVTWSGGGAMIMCEIESRMTSAPTAYTIVNNTIQHGSGIPSVTYGIRLLAINGATVMGNRIYDKTGFGKGIDFAGVDYTAMNWTDPDNTEVDAKARIRNLIIAGNWVEATANAGVIEAVAFAGQCPAPGPQVYGNVVPTLGVYTSSVNPFIIGSGGLGVSNAVAASAVGTLGRKMEIFGAHGDSLGFIPIYNTIT